jgi:hypothetical protein
MIRPPRILFYSSWLEYPYRLSNDAIVVKKMRPLIKMSSPPAKPNSAVGNQISQEITIATCGSCGLYLTST